MSPILNKLYTDSFQACLVLGTSALPTKEISYHKVLSAFKWHIETNTWVSTEHYYRKTESFRFLLGTLLWISLCNKILQKRVTILTHSNCHESWIIELFNLFFFWIRLSNYSLTLLYTLKLGNSNKLKYLVCWKFCLILLLFEIECNI